MNDDVIFKIYMGSDLENRKSSILLYAFPFDPDPEGGVCRIMGWSWSVGVSVLEMEVEMEGSCENSCGVHLSHYELRESVNFLLNEKFELINSLMDSKSYVFVFTLNNYTAEELAHLMVDVPAGYVVVFGKEVAPSTGTPHLQGCLYREDEQRFKRRTAVNIIGKRAWVESSNSLEGAIGYCVKESAWWTNLPDLELRVKEIDQAKKYGGEYTWLGSCFLQFPDESICAASHSLHLFSHNH